MKDSEHSAVRRSAAARTKNGTPFPHNAKTGAAAGTAGAAASAGRKKLTSILLAAVAGFLFAGTQAFPGTFPFGIALCCAASGTIAAFSAFVGALIGCTRIPTGGGCALVLTALISARCVLSLWLADSLPGIRSAGKIPRQPDPDDDGIGNRHPGQSGTEPNGACRTTVRFPTGLTGIVNEKIRAASRVQGIMLRESIRVRLALSACAALFAGAWSAVEGGYAYSDLFGAVFSLLTTPVVTYLLYAAAEKQMRSSPLREGGICLTAAVTALALHQLTRRTGGLAAIPAPFVGVFDAGVFFAFTASAAAALEYGIHRGALLGLACGVTMTPVYAPMFAASAVAAGTLARLSPTVGPIFGILCAGGASVSWAVYTGGLEGLTAALAPVTLGCALLIPAVKTNILHLPPALFGYASASRMRSENASMAELSCGLMKQRIHELSEGFSSVSAVLGALSDKLSRPSRAEMREIAESAFDGYCENCRQREKCHRAKNSKTAPVILKITEELAKEGSVSAAAVPASLAASCWNMGRILDEINLTAARRIAGLREGDRLSTSAADFGLTGELLAHLAKEGRETSSVDEALSRKLKRLLSANDFRAASVTAYGARQKYIFVGDLDLTATRMGGDEIRRTFEEMVGTPLSRPEFELDGASLSMRLHSAYPFRCQAGVFSCAASSVPLYCGGKRGCGADSAETSPADGADGTDESTVIGGTAEIGGAAAADAEAELSVSDAVPDGVCGDGITSFEADGLFYMILSDGMGSGKEAALTSGVAVNLLERMIRAGADLETSLKLLNQVIRSSGRECSATVDVARIDLLTGEARFIKSGAAPSFILRDGSIYRLQSKTIPIGILRALDAEMIRFDVRTGDTVVMISDGAARSYEDAPWLLDLMTSSEVVLRGDERLAAMTIVSEAALRGSKDDITAGVVRILPAGGRM